MFSPLFPVVFPRKNEFQYKDPATQPGEGNCHGFAMGKAFGFPETYCDQLYRGKINTYYFYAIAYDVEEVTAGDIVHFSADHSVWVNYVISANPEDIYIRHKTNTGGTIQDSTLYDIIDYYNSNPDSIYRKRDWNIEVKNKINDQYCFGNVKMANETKQSPAMYHKPGGMDYSITTMVQDNDVFEGYAQIFSTFMRNEYKSIPERAFSDSILYEKNGVTRSCSYVAHFQKLFKLTFRNQYTGVGCYGTIKIGNDTRTVPAEEYVPNTSNITVRAINNTYNHIIYKFDHWSTGSIYNQITIEPHNNSTYTAYFTGKPCPVTVTECGGPAGSFVQITWLLHPNENVTQYQIWRIIKHSLTGTTEGPTLLATLGRNTTTYNDREVIVTSGYVEDLVRYDVRAYYSTEDAYADPNWHSLFGSGRGKDDEPKLACTPNPFNPEIRITVDIAEASVVKLCIFNIQGRQVTVLEDNILYKGRHNFSWHGTDYSGRDLASGIYIAKLYTRVLSSGRTAAISRKLLKTK